MKISPKFYKDSAASLLLIVSFLVQATSVVALRELNIREGNQLSGLASTLTARTQVSPHLAGAEELVPIAQGVQLSRAYLSLAQAIQRSSNAYVDPVEALLGVEAVAAVSLPGLGFMDGLYNRALFNLDIVVYVDQPPAEMFESLTQTLMPAMGDAGGQVVNQNYYESHNFGYFSLSKHIVPNQSVFPMHFRVWVVPVEGLGDRPIVSEGVFVGGLNPMVPTFVRQSRPLPADVTAHLSNQARVVQELGDWRTHLVARAGEYLVGQRQEAPDAEPRARDYLALVVYLHEGLTGVTAMHDEDARWPLRGWYDYFAVERNRNAYVLGPRYVQRVQRVSEEQIGIAGWTLDRRSEGTDTTGVLLALPNATLPGVQLPLEILNGLGEQGLPIYLANVLGLSVVVEGRDIQVRTQDDAIATLEPVDISEEGVVYLIGVNPNPSMFERFDQSVEMREVTPKGVFGSASFGNVALAIRRQGDHVLLQAVTSQYPVSVGMDVGDQLPGVFLEIPSAGQVEVSLEGEGHVATLAFGVDDAAFQLEVHRAADGTVTLHAQEGAAHTLESPRTIGRGDDRDIKLPHAEISRKHTRVSVSGNQLLIEDGHDEEERTASANGTYYRVEPGQEELALNVSVLLEQIELVSDRLFQNTVVFLDPSILDPAALQRLDDLSLTGLQIELRDLFGWPQERGLDLQFVVVPPSARGMTYQQYDGWHVIDVRARGVQAQTVPLSAMPYLIGHAIASGENVFYVNGAAYQWLRQWTLPQIMDRFATFA